MQIEAKHSKQGFHDAVSTSTSRDHLTVEKVRKCSKRARRYMLAYLAFSKIKDQQQDNNDVMELSHTLIETAIKTYKNHRTVDNFDTKWIRKMDIDQKDVDLLQKVVTTMRNCDNCT